MKILHEILNDIYPPKERATSAKYGIVVGLMGSGKTTFAGLLGYAFRDSFGDTFYLYLKDKSEFLETLRSCMDILNENVYIVLDDVSFALFGVTQETRNFLNEFFKIRHYCSGKKRIFTMFIVHYSKSITRFLRGAHLKVLTSIDPVEYEVLKELFSESELIDYYEYYTQHYRDRYILLIRTPRQSRIVDFTLDPETLEKFSK